MKNRIGQTCHFIYPRDFDQWLFETFPNGKGFKHRIKMMLSQDMKPPQSTQESGPWCQTYVKVDHGLAVMLGKYDGESWNAKFQNSANIIPKRKTENNSKQLSLYASVEHKDKLESMGNGNTSAGLRTLCDNSVMLSETQRAALELLGNGSAEEGLKQLIGE